MAEDKQDKIIQLIEDSNSARASNREEFMGILSEHTQQLKHLGSQLNGALLATINTQIDAKSNERIATGAKKIFWVVALMITAAAVGIVFNHIGLVV